MVRFGNVLNSSGAPCNICLDKTNQRGRKIQLPIKMLEEGL